jgi:methyl halide transferase
MSTNLNAEFWSKRYADQQTGWDLGAVSPPLKAYVDQLTDRGLRILIPGCGNAHEGAYLWKKGFKNTHLLDFAEPALKAFNKNYPDFPKEQLHAGDFFKHTGEYELILEQTMFCAIDPRLREDYISKITELLTPKGKYVGVLFDREFEGGPPFGGNSKDYSLLLDKHFSSVSIESCYNSIDPRAGSEVFVIAQK